MSAGTITSAFLRPALVTLAGTLAFLCLFDLGFYAIRTMPAIRDAVPGSIVRYLGHGVSVPGKLERAGAEDWPFPQAGWLGPDAERATRQGLSASPGRHPAWGAGADRPCVTFYGMSFANRMSRALERRHGDAFEVRRVTAPSAPPNWTLAAYMADRPVSGCRDVVVWSILSAGTSALGSTSMLMHGFDYPQIYALPAMRAVDGGVALRWPDLATEADLKAAVRDRARMAAWSATLSDEEAYSPAAWSARWADRSTLLGFLRRGLAVGDIAEVKAAKTGSPEALEASGTAATLALMAERFVAAAEADGSSPVILVIQNRAERAGIAEALCAADGSLPVFDTGLVVDPYDTAQFQSDGHYLPGVDDVLADRFADALSSGGLGCAATLGRRNGA